MLDASIHDLKKQNKSEDTYLLSNIHLYLYGRKLSRTRNKHLNTNFFECFNETLLQ